LKERFIVLFTTAIGSKWKGRVKRAVGVALTVVLLSAVAVVGSSLLGSEVLAAWKAPGNAEKIHVSSGALEGLFSFHAPASTVARFEADSEQEAKLMSQDFSDPSLLKNWKFTLASAPQLLQGLQFYSMITSNTALLQADLYFLSLVFPSLDSLWLSLGTSFTNLANTLIQFDRNFIGVQSLKEFSVFTLPSPTAPSPSPGL
jgi:hypothetical protein